jgi:glutamate synthase (NADPH/NADH) small chain
MGKVTGFKEYKRKNFTLAPVEERVKHYNEFTTPLSQDEMEEQGARCMDCGVPFCHSNYGCPVGNLIPQFNDQVYRGRWKDAFRTLMSTNNFPEFTGRVCPATCETACVLGMNETSIGIKNIEYSIIEKAYQEGWMIPLIPAVKTGKTVAVVGSGPAGLAVANQLNKAGHTVSVYEKESRIGGLVRYGIPNFKLDKQKVVQRRVDLMEEEGVRFILHANVGVTLPIGVLQDTYNAVIITTGAGNPRDLPIENRDAKGIHFAMEFLAQSNSRVEGETFDAEDEILATDKHVVVIGGGDTGSDCVGNSIRQGAKSVTQIELMPKSPDERTDEMPWPTYPRLFKLSTSQAEGSTTEFKMDFNVLSKSFIKDDEGKVTGINCVYIEWEGRGFSEIAGSEFVLKADLILLAMGFLGPLQDDVIKEISLETDERSNIKTTGFKTSVEGVFSAGDSRRGQSLVVWAIHEGRECAVEVDKYLTGKISMLNSKSKAHCEL